MMMAQATKMRRPREVKEVVTRGIFCWRMLLLGFVCAVLLLAVGSESASAASSPPPSPRKPPPVKLSPPPSPPPRSPPPKPTPPRPRPSPKLPPSPPKPLPPSPPPSPMPPSPSPSVPPSPPDLFAADSCSFCAEVSVSDPTVINMVPAICTDMATQVMYDIRDLYSQSNVSNVRNVGNVRISCSSDSRQVTVCTSVRTTALSQVPQTVLDMRVLDWTQVARFYIDDCKPFIAITSMITSTDGCLLSDQYDAYSCDM